MLANELGGSEPTPDDEAIRREVLAALAALGPHLLAASRALDTPTPRAAYPPLRQAAIVLAPYLT